MLWYHGYHHCIVLYIQHTSSWHFNEIWLLTKYQCNKSIQTNSHDNFLFEVYQTLRVNGEITKGVVFGDTFNDASKWTNSKMNSKSIHA